MFTAPFIMIILFAVAMGKSDNKLTPSSKSKRYFLHSICLEELRKQINMEMEASLVYMAMAAHFDNNNVARKGFSKFFSENSKEEREHAEKFIEYINKRSGSIKSFNIQMPENYTWDGGLDALQQALKLEHSVNDQLHNIHGIAEKYDDPHLMDFLESEYLDEQVESIDKIKRYIAILNAMNEGMGEYLLDRQLLGEKDEL